MCRISRSCTLCDFVFLALFTLASCDKSNSRCVPRCVQLTDLVAQIVCWLYICHIDLVVYSWLYSFHSTVLSHNVLLVKCEADVVSAKQRHAAALAMCNVTRRQSHAEVDCRFNELCHRQSLRSVVTPRYSL